MDESTPPSSPAEPGGSPTPGAVEFLTLGLTAAVALAIGVVVGLLVDGWLGTSPVFTLVGLVLGVAASVSVTVTRVRRLLH
jgi:F0F1-type ATP synthase assembly protein I